MDPINIFGREFIFLYPQYLEYLTKVCFPLAVAWLLVFIVKRLRRPKRTLGSRYPLVGVMKFWAKMIVVLTIITIALAWPVSKEDTVFEKSSVDIIFGVDNSLSMRALDVNPKVSRLDIAKREIRGLLANQIIKEGDRVALFNFAKISNAEMPLSTDLQLFASLVEGIDYTRPLDENYWDTDLNYSLIQIYDMISRQEDFDRSEGFTRRGGNARKIVILFTDGEDQFSIDPETTVENQAIRDGTLSQLRKLGVKVYCVGIGTRNGFPWSSLLYGFTPGVDYSDSYTSDWAGQRTRLNVRFLDQLASATYGDVFTIENGSTSASSFLSSIIDSNREFVAVRTDENERQWWLYLVRAALAIVVMAILFY